MKIDGKFIFFNILYYEKYSKIKNKKLLSYNE